MALVGDLAGAYSHRINTRHRLVYQVLEDERVVKILRVWSHYEQYLMGHHLSPSWISQVQRHAIRVTRMPLVSGALCVRHTQGREMGKYGDSGPFALS